MSSTVKALKQQLRQECRQRRREFVQDVARRDEASRDILAKLAALPQFPSAEVLVAYVAAEQEVQTRPAIETALACGRPIAVPCCVGEQLELFRLASWSELQPGRYGIWELAQELRREPSRWIEPSRCHILLVPGLAFDRRGGRLGYGRGYYDRLLGSASSPLRVALAFQCQLVEQVPVEPHDARVDFVVTEQVVHDCRGVRVG